MVAPLLLVLVHPGHEVNSFPMLCALGHDVLTYHRPKSKGANNDLNPL